MDAVAVERDRYLVHGSPRSRQPLCRLAHDDERGAAAGGTAGRSLRIVRIEYGPSIGGMATAREAKMLAHGLADDLSTGIEDAGHNGCVHVRDVALQHVGTVHHRDAGN